MKKGGITLFGKWDEDLIWCPSQCHLRIKYNGEIYTLYLRWRHNDPWQGRVWKGKEEDFKKNEWSPDLFLKYHIQFKDSELKLAEKEIIRLAERYLSENKLKSKKLKKGGIIKKKSTLESFNPEDEARGEILIKSNGMKKETKTIKAWAIIPSFPDKELAKFPFLDEDRCFLIFLTKKWAEETNKHMDELVVPVEIKILKDKNW